MASSKTPGPKPPTPSKRQPTKGKRGVPTGQPKTASNAKAWKPYSK